jgi:hypothetical protein
MKVEIIGKGEENESLITYKLRIELDNGQLVEARLVTDRDGNYAEWLDPVPPEIDCGERLGESWDELVSILDEIPQVEADCTRYNEGEEE